MFYPPDDGGYSTPPSNSPTPATLSPSYIQSHYSPTRPTTSSPDWMLHPHSPPRPAQDEPQSPTSDTSSSVEDDFELPYAAQYAEELEDIRLIDSQVMWSTAYKDYRRAAAVLLIAESIGFTISYANHAVIPKQGTTLRFDGLLESLNCIPNTWKNKFGLFWKVRDFMVACQQADHHNVDLTPPMERWRRILSQWESKPSPCVGDEWWCGGKRGSQKCRQELQGLIVSITHQMRCYLTLTLHFQDELTPEE